MNSIAKQFIKFIKDSPTAFHAVKTMARTLKATRLDETQPLSVKKGGLYLIERGGALMVFRLPTGNAKRLALLGSHTDSPALKLKLQGKTYEDMHLLGTEVYGSPHLPSWMGSDLCIAGKIIHLKEGKLQEKLVHLDKMPCTLANLPIHLDGSPNREGFKVDKETHLRPLFSLSEEKLSLAKLLGVKEILGTDLYLVPMDEPRLIGPKAEMLSSYRIDNLSSAYAAMLAMSTSKARSDTIQMAVFWNHEEVGSLTEEGAQSPFFVGTLTRLCLALKLDPEEQFMIRRRSFAVSMDAAHALHPNYKEQYDACNAPRLGKGVTIKHNANCRYACSAEMVARIKHAMKLGKIPYQDYTSHASKPCGTTIGPIFTTGSGVPTVDVGIPILGMHSRKEQMSCADLEALCKMAKRVIDKE